MGDAATMEDSGVVMKYFTDKRMEVDSWEGLDLDMNRILAGILNKLLLYDLKRKIPKLLLVR